MVQIEIPNGVIREIEKPDLDKIAALCADREVTKHFFLGQNGFSSVAYWQSVLQRQLKARSFEDAIVRRDYLLAIETESQVVGITSFHLQPYECSPLRYKAELGCFIGREFRRRGIAKSCLKAALPFCFQYLKADSVYATCLSKNTASINLLEEMGLKNGFEGLSHEEESLGRKIVIYEIDFRDFIHPKERAAKL